MLHSSRNRKNDIKHWDVGSYIKIHTAFENFIIIKNNVTVHTYQIFERKYKILLVYSTTHCVNRKLFSKGPEAKITRHFFFSFQRWNISVTIAKVLGKRSAVCTVWLRKPFVLRKGLALVVLKTVKRIPFFSRCIPLASELLEPV